MEHIDVERQLIGIYRARGWLRRYVTFPVEYDLRPTVKEPHGVRATGHQLVTVCSNSSVNRDLRNNALPAIGEFGKRDRTQRRRRQFLRINFRPRSTARL